MNQSEASNHHKSSLLASSATEDELIVSKILLDLRKQFSLSESLADFSWGCKRRRSCPDEDPPLPRESERKSTAEKGAGTAVSSPTTPLSFSPSESDEKYNRSFSKALKKMAREIEVLIQNRDVLRGGIENAKRHYDKLKAYNSELKAIKHGVINNKLRRTEDAQVEVELRGGDDRIGDVAPHLQPSIADPTAQPMPEHPIGLIRTRYRDRVGPLGIDLNVPAAEEFGEPLDASVAMENKRARFAEARKRRRGLMRVKSMKGSSNYRGGVAVKNWQHVDNYENRVLQLF